MIDLNERAKTMRVAKESIFKQNKLNDEQKMIVLFELLKKLIKYRAHKV
jgi:hypothetical protein